MRFTKIPLIATLMAVALSLLIVLPTLAQVSGDSTDGRQSVGDYLDIRVAADLDDLDNTRGNNTPASIGATDGAFALATPPFQARDTYFNGDLYVSNQGEAFNTILITARVADTSELDASGPTGKQDDPATGTPTAPVDESVANCLGSTDGETGGSAVATIRNTRSNTRVTAYLAPSTSPADAGATVYQGVAFVWDQEDAIEAHHGPCDVPHMTPEMATPTDLQTAVDDGTDTTGAHTSDDNWTHRSAAVIPARDGDTITITVDGVSGSIDLIVDGEAPEVDEIAPSNGQVTNKSTVNLEFRVRDTGAGLRYDGESGQSTDQDPEPHNGDGDQRFNEPITKKDPGVDTILGNADDTDGDGATLDFQVYFASDDDSLTLPYVYGDTCTGVTAGEQTNDAQCSDGTDMVDNPANPLYAGYRINFDDTDESSRYGSNGWTENVKGVSYSLDMTLVENAKILQEYFWQVSVTDRVGNTALTDGDDKDGKQPFSFTVDDQDPEITVARTGIGYEDGEGEIRSRSWIALTVENSGSAGGADRVDGGTVEPGDFTVQGHTVVNAIVPDDKRTCEGNDPRTDRVDESAKNITAFDAGDGGDKVLVEADAGPPAVAEVRSEVAEMCDFEPRARIYLELADELESDETPDIQLLGGVFRDVAGNPNVVQQFTDTDDRIAPGISISITSNTGTTGRVATNSKGSFSVRVTSDEELPSFPRLWFATIEGTDPDADDDSVGDATKLMVDGASSVTNGISLQEKENNVWETTVKVSDGAKVPGSGDRILAVIVTAEDEARNSGNSAGWSDGGGAAAGPDSGDALDFKKLDAGGFLVEVDSELLQAVVSVLPPTNPNADVKNQTESTNPYIQITFPAEAVEYGIPVDEADDEDDTTTDVMHTADDPNVAYKAAIKDEKSRPTDSHPDVTFTALTLNGEPMLDDLVRVKAGEYVLAVTGLDIGEYTLAYEVMDDVGNEVAEDDREFDFEVQERQPYDVDLTPGWNLISLPGDPFNPAVGNVMGDLKADTVLGYQAGEWVTAVKDEETGRWQGTLTDIQGGYGYWVRTAVVETIETVIPPILPTSNLPTVPVISGWNLLGVVDAEQRDAGETADADEYFTSLPNWRVAYSFETQQNRWTKLLPTQADTNVENGRGYWVWSSRPGTLVP